MFYIIKIGHIVPGLFFTTWPYVLFIKLIHLPGDILNKVLKCVMLIMIFLLNLFVQNDHGFFSNSPAFWFLCALSSLLIFRLFYAFQNVAWRTAQNTRWAMGHCRGWWDHYLPCSTCSIFIPFHFSSFLKNLIKNILWSSHLVSKEKGSKV